MNNTEWIRRAYANLRQNESVLRSMIINATEASPREGGGCTLELFPDGTYRGLWDYQISGNVSSGVLIPLPKLSWSPPYSEHHFTQAIEEMDRRVEDLINLVSANQ